MLSRFINNLFGHRTPVIRPNIAVIDFGAAFRRSLVQEDPLIQEFVSKLKQWAGNRWSRQSDIDDLAKYGANTLLEGLEKVAYFRPPIEKAMEDIKKDYLKPYMIKHNWTEATAEDLCEKVIVPFWKEKNGIIKLSLKPGQIAPEPARDTQNTRGMRR